MSRAGTSSVLVCTPSSWYIRGPDGALNGSCKFRLDVRYPTKSYQRGHSYTAGGSRVVHHHHHHHHRFFCVGGTRDTGSRMGCMKDLQCQYRIQIASYQSKPEILVNCDFYTFVAYVHTLNKHLNQMSTFIQVRKWKNWYIFDKQNVLVGTSLMHKSQNVEEKKTSKLR